jgi:nucleoid DNA-binding protein
MDAPSPDALQRAFTEVVRQQLMRREPVSIPEVGTLSVRHEPSRTDVDAEGRDALLPPRDVVLFEPDA